MLFFNLYKSYSCLVSLILAIVNFYIKIVIKHSIYIILYFFKANIVKVVLFYIILQDY